MNPKSIYQNALNHKIGILTAARTDNYGTDLQTFAMFKIFSRFFDRVEIIDYKNEKLDEKIFGKKLSLGTVLNFPIRLYSIFSHRLFRKKNLVKSSITYEKNNINLLNNEYDMIIVGSDQIWNLNITGNDTIFFLPFYEKNKVSYAASFGNFDLKNNNIIDIKKALINFNYISVREELTQLELKQIGIDAFHDLDPLLLVDNSVWHELANVKRTGKYIFLYFADFSQDALDFAIRLGKEKNLRIITITNSFRNIKGIIQMRFVSIKSFLGLIKNSSYIVTNSYHCMSFAYIFEKELFIFEAKDNNSRLQSLATMTQTQYFFQHNINRSETDWEHVKQLIKQKKDESYKRISCKIINEIFGDYEC